MAKLVLFSERRSLVLLFSSLSLIFLSIFFRATSRCAVFSTITSMYSVIIPLMTSSNASFAPPTLDLPNIPVTFKSK